MRARFGTAGNPEGFYAAGKKQSKQMPGWLRERGLDAYEYQCGKGVTVGEATARAIGQAAAQAGIALSLHAPYFVNPGYQDILLCPETMGKINQLGDLEEVLTLCTEAEGLLPCVDFGHLYARSLGALDGPEAVERMLDQMVRELGVARASQFHSHFSKIAYTPRGGEARHLTFDQPDFGPDPAPLCEALARRGWSPRVICESAGTQDVDALWMKGAYLRALGETAEG